MDESEYLQPDFDPKSLKVAQLRNVLLQNDVEYASSAKKADLVKLFNTHIKPSAKKRLQIVESVVANDHSIEVVDVKGKKNEQVKPQVVSISDDDNDEVEVLSVQKSSKKLAQVRSPTPDMTHPRKASGRRVKKESTNSDLDSDDDEDDDEDNNDKDHEEEGEDDDEKPKSRKSKRKSSRNKSEQVSDSRTRSKSPRKRSTSKKLELSPTRVTRSVSSSQQNVETEDDNQRERSPIRRSSRSVKSEEPGDSNDSNKSVIESVVEHFNASSTQDNIFQKTTSSTSKSRNPKKRAADEDDRKNSKHQQTKPLRKTLFSEPKKHSLKSSPTKTSLSIEKFEKAPASTINGSKQKGSLFDSDDESFEKALERLPGVKSPTKPAEPEPELEVNQQQESSAKENPTPGEPTIVNDTSVANTSKYTYDITEETPSIRKHIIPVASKGKYSPKPSPKVNKVLEFEKFTAEESSKPAINADESRDLIEETSQDDNGIIEIEKEFGPEDDTLEKIPETQVAEDEDLEAEEEDEDSIFKIEDEINSHPNDDDIANLQKEIEITNHQILEEAEQAVKEINEILEGEKQIEEDKEQLEEDGEMDAETLRRPFVNMNAIVDFINSFLFFAFFISVVIGALWYREQRILIGYCGSEIYQPSIPNPTNEFASQVNDFLEDYKPGCLPCPENAICLPSLQIKCKADYVVKEPWYKLYGLLPFSDYCVKNTKKERIVKDIVTKSLELLRIRNANYKCGDGNNEEDLAKVGISDEELYDFFFRTKKSFVRDEDFNELWDKVLEDLSKEPEITLHNNWGNDSSNTNNSISTDEITSERPVHEKTIFRSTSPLKLSIQCKFQKEISDRFQKYKIYIIISGAALFGGVLAYLKVLSHLNKKRRIHEITEVIIGKLMKQQKFAINDPTGLTNRYLSTITLRDELLANLSNSRRIEIWSTILKNLEANANVRSMTKEIHGEIVRVLEWIGE